MKKAVPSASELFPPPSLEDSPDFSEVESNSAVVVPDSKTMGEQLGHLCCVSCQERLVVTEHALRRRAGVHYSRVALTCPAGHTETKIFRLDWLNGAPT